MARRRQSTEYDPHAPRDAMFGSLRLKHFEGSRHIRTFRLPLPSFAPRWLLSSTNFTLSRLWHIHGHEGACKSALATELIRWHMLYGGGGYVAENENKDYEAMRLGIWLHHPVWLSRYDKQPTRCVEEWQQYCSDTIRHTKETMDAPGGIGRTMPVAWLVDSLVGTSAQADIQKILDTGHASAGYLAAPPIITRYLKAMPMMVQDYPFTFIFTNHAKPAILPPGTRVLPGQEQPITTPGATHVKFAETYELELKRIKDVETPEFGGIRVMIRCRKNSDGVSRRRMQVDFLWWFETTPEGGRVQKFAWDWHTAAIEMLLAYNSDKTKKTFNAVQDIVNLGVKSKAGRIGWSEPLGVPRDSPVPFRVLGKRLETQPAILAQLYSLFNVVESEISPEFQSYIDCVGMHEAPMFYQQQEEDAGELPVWEGTDDGPEAEGDD